MSELRHKWSSSGVVVASAHIGATYYPLSQNLSLDVLDDLDDLDRCYDRQLSSSSN